MSKVPEGTGYVITLPISGARTRPYRPTPQAGESAMPHYLFHIRTTEGIEADHEGIVFADIDAAKADARASLFEMMAEDLAGGQKTKYLAIEITDVVGTVLAVVEAGDAIK